MTTPPLALVLTPVASAPALAGLCAMAGIDVHVVPSTAGAIAGIELQPREPSQDWDIGDIIGSPAIPPEADELARKLSTLAKTGVVLLTGSLSAAEQSGEQLAGQLSALRYEAGEPAEEVPVGLLLAGADDIVEELILRQVALSEVPGHQRSGDLPRWKAARMFAKGLRRRN